MAAPTRYVVEAAALRGLGWSLERLAARTASPRFRLEETQRDYEATVVGRHGCSAAEEAGADSLALAAFGGRLAKLSAQIVQDAAPWADRPANTAENLRKAVIVREMILDALDLPLLVHRVVEAAAQLSAASTSLLDVASTDT